MIKCASTEAEFKQLITLQQKRWRNLHGQRRMKEHTWTHLASAEGESCRVSRYHWEHFSLSSTAGIHSRAPHEQTPTYSTEQHSTAQCVSRSLTVGCADQGLMAGSPCRFKVRQTHSRCRGLYKAEQHILEWGKTQPQVPGGSSRRGAI